MRKQWLFPIGKQKYKIEKQSKSNTQRVKTNLAYASPFPILNEFLSFEWTKFETMLSIVLCEAIFKFSYMFFLNLCPFHSWQSAIFMRSVRWPPMHLERRAIVTRLRSLMDFTLRNTSQQLGNLSEHARVESAWARENCVWRAGNLKTKINHS